MIYRAYYVEGLKLKRFNLFDYSSVEEIENFLENPPLKYDFGTRIQLVVMMGIGPKQKIAKVIEPRKTEIWK